MSNKAEQLRHIYGGYDRSIDAPAGIRGRTGDVEDGDTLGSLLRDDSATAEDLLLASEDREPRIKFLKQFFALLKQTLSPDECKFIKLRFTKKKTDRQIAVWLGFKSVSGVFASIKDKLRAQERTIKRLAERSQWDGAALFVRQITTSVNELSRDESVIKAKVPTPAHGYYAMQQAIERAEARENASEESKIRRRFYMRGVYQASKAIATYTKNLETFTSKVMAALTVLPAYTNYLTNSILKQEQRESLEAIRQDFNEFILMLKYQIFNPHDELMKLVASKITDYCITLDLDPEKKHAHFKDEKIQYGLMKNFSKRKKDYYEEFSSLPLWKRTEERAELLLIEKNKQNSALTMQE